MRQNLSSLVVVNEWNPQKEDDVKVVYGLMSEPKDTICIGIDPGVNFGISIITGKQILICNGKLPVRKTAGEHGKDAYEFVMEHIIQHVDGAALSVVEGAAYDKTFGQVGLAEVRFGFYLGLYVRNANPQICAIKTIRASVLGSGKETAFDRWPLLNHNAADSLGCALMAYSLADK